MSKGTIRARFIGNSNQLLINTGEFSGKRAIKTYAEHGDVLEFDLDDPEQERRFLAVRDRFQLLDQVDERESRGTPAPAPVPPEEEEASAAPPEEEEPEVEEEAAEDGTDVDWDEYYSGASAADLISDIADFDLDSLSKIHSLETENKARTTVLKAIAVRESELGGE